MSFALRRAAGVLLGTGVFLSWGSWIGAQVDNPTIRVAPGTYAVAPGGSVTVPLEVGSDAPVTGFSLGVQHDGAQLAITRVRVGEDLQNLVGDDGLDERFFVVNRNPQGGPGFTAAAIFSVDDPDVFLPPDAFHSVLEVDYVAKAASSGSTVLKVTGGLGDPAVALVLDVEGGRAVSVSESESTILISVDFKRGDVDQDGDFAITDAVQILLYLFGGRGDIGENCLVSLDVDADGDVTLSDAPYLLDYLYRRGQPPPAPFPDCGQPTQPVPTEQVCKEHAACTP